MMQKELSLELMELSIWVGRAGHKEETSNLNPNPREDLFNPPRHWGKIQEVKLWWPNWREEHHRTQFKPEGFKLCVEVGYKVPY